MPAPLIIPPLQPISALAGDNGDYVNDELAEGLRSIFNLGIEDGSLRKDIEIDITISQFLYSFRAILSRAFSDSYSFAKFDKSKYTNHFLNQFTLSVKD